MNKLANQTASHNGFPMVVFQDMYDNGCSLQASSIWEDDNRCGESAVWLGINDADPKVMAREASGLGIKTSQKDGWVPYPVPPNVQLNTRMHLNRDQVAALIDHLKLWLETGQFEQKDTLN